MVGDVRSFQGLLAGRQYPKSALTDRLNTRCLQSNAETVTEF